MGNQPQGRTQYASVNSAGQSVGFAEGPVVMGNTIDPDSVKQKAGETEGEAMVRMERARLAESRIGKRAIKKKSLYQTKLDHMRTYDAIDKKQLTAPAPSATVTTSQAGHTLGTAPGLQKQSSLDKNKPVDKKKEAKINKHWDTYNDIDAKEKEKLAKEGTKKDGEIKASSPTNQTDSKRSGQAPVPREVSQEADEEEDASDLEINLIELWTSSPATIDLLRKVLQNIVNSPNEEKFRKLKLSGDKMTKLVQQVPKALDSFILIGFEQVTMPSDKGTLETYLIYKSDKSLDLPKLVLAQLPVPSVTS